MTTILSIVRYPKYGGWLGFISMAIFHFPLFLNKKISFYKLMGCGKNGTFDKNPDWRQWAVLVVTKEQVPSAKSIKNLQGRLITFFWHLCKAEPMHIVLTPIESHGLWDKQKCFGALPAKSDYEGPIAVLTRATIRLSKLKSFWQNVPAVAQQMSTAKGFIFSVGVGEAPFIKQATFSVWRSKKEMAAFAYSMQEHKTVIQKTRKENWYSEDMFTRFKVEKIFGTLQGSNPLQDIA